MAVLLYYLIRVRKSSGKSMKEKMGFLGKLFKRDAEKDNTKNTQVKKEAPLAKGEKTAN
jgi:ATP-binding cassette subfamily G (WHITE) protein 2 (PDR)